MLSPAEKRFMKYWEEQRVGGRRNYLALYTFCWTMIGILSPILLGAIFSWFGFDDVTWPAVVLAVLTIVTISLLVSNYFWIKNETRYNTLSGRE